MAIRDVRQGDANQVGGQQTLDLLADGLRELKRMRAHEQRPLNLELRRPFAEKVARKWRTTFL